MSESVTPTALGMIPAIKPVLVRRFEPAVCAQASTRAWMTEAGVLSVVERTKSRQGSGRRPSTSRPRASASRRAARSGPLPRFGIPARAEQDRSPERAKRAPQRCSWAALASVSYSRRARSSPPHDLVFCEVSRGRQIRTFLREHAGKHVFGISLFSSSISSDGSVHPVLRGNAVVFVSLLGEVPSRMPRRLRPLAGVLLRRKVRILSLSHDLSHPFVQNTRS